LIEQNHTCSEFLKDEEWDRNIERTEMKGFCQKWIEVYSLIISIIYTSTNDDHLHLSDPIKLKTKI
jgi:hypothetical protein